MEAGNHGIHGVDKESIKYINQIIDLRDDVTQITGIINEIDAKKHNIDDALHLCCYFNLPTILKLLLDKGTNTIL